MRLKYGTDHPRWGKGLCSASKTVRFDAKQKHASFTDSTTATRRSARQALSFALSKPREIVVVADPGSADTQALLSVLRNGYWPLQVVALGLPETQPPAIPRLQERDLVDGHAAAYMCANFACQAPVADPEELRALLRRKEAGSRA